MKDTREPRTSVPISTNAHETQTSVRSVARVLILKEALNVCATRLDLDLETKDAPA